MSISMSAAAVSERIRRVGELSSLAVERRLDAKIDYSPRAIDLRLRKVSRLRALCLRLSEVGQAPRRENPP